MPVKIFVGNLQHGVTNAIVRGLFEPYGKITECAVLGAFGFVVSINFSFSIITVD